MTFIPGRWPAELPHRVIALHVGVTHWLARYGVLISRLGLGVSRTADELEARCT